MSEIDQIKQLIEEAGFPLRFFFLTQPPLPNQRHEKRRKAIARRMHRAGLSVHDLAPQSVARSCGANPLDAREMKEMVIMNDNTAVAVAAPNSTAVAISNQAACDQYLDEIAPASIVGRLIKFKKGKFVIADDDTEIGEDDDFICFADSTIVGWVKFNEEGPPDRVMGPLYDGFIMPERETLGDLDQSKWEKGLDGKPADPFQHHIYLVLQKAATQEFFTYVASTVTSRRSVGNLLRHYNRTLRMGSTDYPVIRLKVSGFNHKDERVGWVPTPAFVVVGKTPREGAVTPPDTSPSSDMSDAIPF